MSKAGFDPDAMRARIRSRIAAQGRTQAEVADKAGLGHGYLTNILARGQMPAVDKVHALAAELGVSVAWLMYGDAGPQGQDVERLRLDVIRMALAADADTLLSLHRRLLDASGQ